MRIGKKTHVEYQVGVFRHSVLESEAYARHQNIFAGLLFLKTLSDMRPQFVNIKFRSVDYHVRDRADVAAR